MTAETKTQSGKKLILVAGLAAGGEPFMVVLSFILDSLGAPPILSGPAFLGFLLFYFPGDAFAPTKPRGSCARSIILPQTEAAKECVRIVSSAAAGRQLL